MSDRNAPRGEPATEAAAREDAPRRWPPEADVPPKKSRWEQVQPFTPLIQTFVTVIVGGLLAYALTGRIASAIEQRKLELSHVTAMREIYLRLLSTDTTAAQAYADAHALAMFRDYSVAPFVTLLQQTDPPFLRDAAMSGLRSVALTDRELVARQMLRIATNGSGLYHWRAHLGAIQLLGELRWAAARRPLERLRAAVGVANVDSAAAALAARVSPDARPNEDDVVRVQAVLDRALAELARRDQP